MGQVFFILLALFFSYQILSKSRSEKISWYFAGIMFLPPAVVIFSKPHMPFYRLIIYIFLFTTIGQNKHLSKLVQEFPFKAVMVLLFFLLMCIGIFDERVDTFLRIYRPLNYFAENFFVTILLFLYVKKPSDVVKVYKTILLFVFIFCVYGLSNYLTKQNEFYNFIANAYGGRDFANDNMSVGKDRFRISSFAWHSLYYGFILNISILLLLFNFFSFNLKTKTKWLYIVFFLMSLLNIFLVNSRTPLYTLVLGTGIFILFSANLTQKIKIAIAAIILFFGALTFVPSASKLIDESINTFSSNGSNLEGSSVQMREIQLAASLNIFQESPITGHGFAYIVEGLGYSSDKNKRQTGNDLMGFESYTFKLLIEQGLLGIIGNIIFFSAIIIWLLFQYKKVDPFGKKLIILSSSILATFLLFIVGTGDLGSFPFTLSILGMNFRAIQLSQIKNIKKNLKINLMYQDTSH